MPVGIEMHLIHEHVRGEFLARTQVKNSYAPASQCGHGCFSKMPIVARMIYIRLHGNEKSVMERGSDFLHFGEVVHIMMGGKIDGGRGRFPPIQSSRPEPDPGIFHPMADAWEQKPGQIGEAFQ